MSTPQLKQGYGAEHREKTDLLSKLRREINDLIKSSDRHDLLGDSGEATTDSPYNNDERGGLLQGLDRVEDGNRRLENSHRVALDTEDIGADILRNLRMQREQIENTHNTLGQADTGGCIVDALDLLTQSRPRHRQINENTETNVETLHKTKGSDVAYHWRTHLAHPDRPLGQIHVKRCILHLVLLPPCCNHSYAARLMHR